MAQMKDFSAVCCTCIFVTFHTMYLLKIPLVVRMPAAVTAVPLHILDRSATVSLGTDLPAMEPAVKVCQPFIPLETTATE